MNSVGRREEGGGRREEGGGKGEEGGGRREEGGGRREEGGGRREEGGGRREGGESEWCQVVTVRSCCLRCRWRPTRRGWLLVGVLRHPRGRLRAVFRAGNPSGL